MGLVDQLNEVAVGSEAHQAVHNSFIVLSVDSNESVLGKCVALTLVVGLEAEFLDDDHVGCFVVDDAVLEELVIGAEVARLALLRAFVIVLDSDSGI